MRNSLEDIIEKYSGIRNITFRQLSKKYKKYDLCIHQYKYYESKLFK